MCLDSLLTEDLRSVKAKVGVVACDGTSIKVLSQCFSTPTPIEKV